MILHLKSHLRSALPLPQRKITSPSVPTMPTINLKTLVESHRNTKSNSTFLKKGFYHPAIKKPEKWVTTKQVKSEVGGDVSVLKSGIVKPKTQYYIYKEKGQVKKVIKTIFKPKAKKEPISVGDELSCNLDDLLKTFEVEETEEKGELASLLKSGFSKSKSYFVDPLEISDNESIPCMGDEVESREDNEATEETDLHVEDTIDDCPAEDCEDQNKNINCVDYSSSSCEVNVLKKNPRDEISLEFNVESVKERNDTKTFKAVKRVKAESTNATASRTGTETQHSRCKLCSASFSSFRKLLAHITHRHFKSEMNTIITRRYPGFWRAEKLKEDKEQVCEDCGHRMKTRGQLHTHLGVEHNLLWDVYLARVQSCKKAARPQTDSSSKQTANYLKEKKSKQDYNSAKLPPARQAETLEADQKRKTSFFKDHKLILIPDENPYSKKFIFSNKTKSDSPTTAEEDDRKDKTSLLETIAVNVASSLQEPYCAVCQLLLEPGARARLGDTPTRSLEKVPAQSAVWSPWQPGRHLVSPLLVCRRCKVCVHRDCYNPALAGAAATEEWTCDGCLRAGACVICHEAGPGAGPLRTTTEGRLCHLVCALLVPEAAVTARGEVDTSLVPAKRSTVECLVCGGRGGRPVVHCHASPSCQVALHPRCGLRDMVDVVIGAEAGSVIMRCSFCLERIRQAAPEQTETTKFRENDLEVGETVTVTRPDGGRSIAVVLEISEDRYVAVAFDDGTYCDTLEPGDVKFVSGEAEDQAENCPVSVSWEGGTYSGVFKGTNTLYWYKLQTVDKMDTLEVERKDITKNA